MNRMGFPVYKKAQSFEVDLIICDVLMPGMNGFDVTRKLKRDFETSHIPITFADCYEHFGK